MCQSSSSKPEEYGNSTSNSQSNQRVEGSNAATGFGFTPVNLGQISVPLRMNCSTITTNSPGGEVFGQQHVSGTSIKFNPITGPDTMMKYGVQKNITARHQVR